MASSTRRALVALAGAASAFALLVVPAGGVTLGNSHGLRYEFNSFSPLFAGTATVGALCPEPTGVIGGGVHITGPAAKSRVEKSAPFDSGDPGSVPEAWAGQATNLADHPRRVEVFAICRASGPLGIAYPEWQESMVAGETATVSCPVDMSVVAGGYGLHAGNVVRSVPMDGPDAGERPDDGWLARGRNNGPNTYLGVYAVCVDAGPGYVRYRSAKGRVAGGQSKSVTATCPDNRAVSGGGVALGGGATSSFIHSMQPRDSNADGNQVPEDRWVTSVFNGGSAKRTATAHAICLR